MRIAGEGSALPACPSREGVAAKVLSRYCSDMSNRGPDENFDNDIVCRAVYNWCKEKSEGREPYSPFVASVTILVLDILKLERERKK